MRSVIVIPARFASSRYPGKPLVPLTGATGQARSLIRRSWDAARAVPGGHRVIVATDDARIQAHAEAFGAEVVMTPESCANGTERCAAALTALNGALAESDVADSDVADSDVADSDVADGNVADSDVIVNLQGDAPLTPPWFVEALIAAMADPAVAVATPVLRCDHAALAGFLEDRAAGRVGGTTAVFDASGRALYFSKEVLPFTGRALTPQDPVPVFHHVGVYAYRAGLLARYPEWPEGPLERWEGLEQLRFLEQGQEIACVEVEARGAVFWELNNPQDVPRIEAALAASGQP
ncbi:MAG: manno-octulosonate cytidylyltransferase [Pseudomonadota bacterium]